ncbi:MAG TPA: ABC transporter permease [Vicinamibacterales bacterium]|nr:ABC transporter permease [Vicinamibacterales bacterium]
MLREIRQSIRSLWAAPAFTAVALVVLTLGIGASTAIFSVVDAVVLRGLPYDEGDRLVQVTVHQEQTGSYRSVHTPQDFADFRLRQDVFQSLAATGSGGGFTVADGGRPEDLRTMQVTASFFDVFRVQPQVGRPFAVEHEVEGNHFVALISDGLWRRRFGADPGVVGRTIQFPAGSWQVVGVMPSGFQYPASASRPYDLWVPYVVPENQKQRGDSRRFHLTVTGRLKDGVSVQQADAGMQALVAALAVDSPHWFRGQTGSARSLYEATVGRVRSWMLMLLGAVGIVLLVACVNVASLMLARATARGREIQIRAALGASRWQVARSLLVESLVLSTAGTAAGVLVALWGVEVLRAALPSTLPRIASVGIDLRVLGAAALAALATGVFFGLFPALQSSRPDLSGALREGGRGMTGGRARLRSALVVAEVALAVVLVVGAGLFVASFVRLTNVEIGVDHRNVMTMGVWPRVDSTKPGWFKPAQEQAGIAIPAIVERVRAIPGVEHAGFISGGLPLSGDWSRTDVNVPGREEPFSGDDAVEIREVTAGYALAIGAVVRRGRHVADTDTRTAVPVVVLNEAAAQRYLPERDPLGATVTISDIDRTVIGVVANVRLGGPESTVRPEAYVPIAQSAIVGGDLAIRTAGDPLAIAEQVRQAIWASLPDVPAPEAQTMTSLLQGLVAQREFNMLIVSLFGVLALAIAAVGIYGVIGYTVAQRTQEIGVRMALGAVPASVLTMVLGRATLFVAIGLGLGLVGAWQLARFVEAFLFEVTPHDPAVYAAAGGVLLLAGLLAAYLPARRASRVDPVIALRGD